MATEVGLIMSGTKDQPADTVHRVKMTHSLHNMLLWLDANLSLAIAVLHRPRDLGYLEVALFCLVAHLEFRGRHVYDGVREAGRVSR